MRSRAVSLPYQEEFAQEDTKTVSETPRNVSVGRKPDRMFNLEVLLVNTGLAASQHGLRLHGRELVRKRRLDLHRSPLLLGRGGRLGGRGLRGAGELEGRREPPRESAGGARSEASPKRLPRGPGKGVA